MRAARMLRRLRADDPAHGVLCGLVNNDPVKGMQEYLERYVYGPKSWTDFLDLIGMDEMLDGRARREEHLRCLAHASHTGGRAARDSERAPAQGRAGGVRRRRHSAAGGDARAATALSRPDDPVRGRRDRRVHRARQAAALDQRPALHQARQHGARQRRSAAAAAARLRRCRLHGRRADRPVRQSQQLVHRRSRRSRRRACPAPAAATTSASLANDDRRDEAREAPLRGAGRFHHQPRLAPRRRHAARKRPAHGRHVPRGHGSGGVRFDDDDAPDEGRSRSIPA